LDPSQDDATTNGPPQHPSGKRIDEMAVTMLGLTFMYSFIHPFTCSNRQAGKQPVGVEVQRQRSLCMATERYTAAARKKDETRMPERRCDDRVVLANI